MSNFIKHKALPQNGKPDRASNKAAIFDLDDTLIKAIGKKFSVTDVDWEFESDNVIPKLRQLYDDGYDIIILSNQKGKKGDEVKLWIQKINNMVNEIRVPILALASLNDDDLRKPRTGMWTKFLNTYNKDHSFFCGDAGGLPKRKLNGVMIKKDFADTDLKFALNVGIKFYHRDEYFYGVTGLKLVPTYVNFNAITKGKYDDLVIKKGIMIINVGYPGCGKSYFSKNHIKSNDTIVYINRDTLGTIEKCIAVCEKSAKDNLAIIIDNTNPTKSDRKAFIDIGKKYKYNIECVKLTTPKELAIHNNIYRSLTTGTQIVPTIAYNIYTSKYEEPSTDEGFTKIHKLDFILHDQCKSDFFKYYS